MFINTSLHQINNEALDQQSIRKNHSGFFKLFLELLFGLFQVVRLETRRVFQVLFLESTASYMYLL